VQVYRTASHERSPPSEAAKAGIAAAVKCLQAMAQAAPAGEKTFFADMREAHVVNIEACRKYLPAG